MKIKVKVRPCSGKQEIKEDSNLLLVSLKSAPENGKANSELIKILKKYFKNKINFQDIKIIKGLNSRKKVIEVK